jgi:hypothetical protein
MLGIARSGASGSWVRCLWRGEEVFGESTVREVPMGRLGFPANSLIPL